MGLIITGPPSQGVFPTISLSFLRPKVAEVVPIPGSVNGVEKCMATFFRWGDNPDHVGSFQLPTCLLYIYIHKYIFECVICNERYTIFI